MNFTVIDTKTGEYPDLSDIALHEEWAQDLMYCDMEGFAILEDGTLILIDECGRVTYCPEGRFQIVPDEPNEPLTLEQLREMDGEPVWVKQLKGLSVCDTGWAVVEFRLAPDVKHDKIRVWWPGSEDEDTPSEDDYGKTWLAYRRPPVGDAYD